MKRELRDLFLSDLENKGKGKPGGSSSSFRSVSEKGREGQAHLGDNNVVPVYVDHYKKSSSRSSRSKDLRKGGVYSKKRGGGGGALSGRSPRPRDHLPPMARAPTPFSAAPQALPLSLPLPVFTSLNSIIAQREKGKATTSTATSSEKGAKARGKGIRAGARAGVGVNGYEDEDAVLEAIALRSLKERGRWDVRGGEGQGDGDASQSSGVKGAGAGATQQTVSGGGSVSSLGNPTPPPSLAPADPDPHLDPDGVRIISRVSSIDDESVGSLVLGTL